MSRSIALVAVAVSGCAYEDLGAHDEIFAAPGERVLCAANVDDGRYDDDAIASGLARARDDHEILQLFAHDPGETIAVARIEAILDGAARRGLPTVTYRELADGVTGPGLALSFDDFYVAHWAALGPVLARHHARVTFFVADYDTFTPDERAQLRGLADDGHDLEYHSTRHLDAPAYVAAHGLAAYLADEIDPALAAMHDDGLEPIVFAYPLGKRTAELDDALLARFAVVRATTLYCPR